MAKKEQQPSSEGQSPKTKEFIKKNWPVALAIAGAAGAIGASVWLTARFLREKKEREEKVDTALKLIEREVEEMSDPTAIILETGSYLSRVGGRETVEAAEELARNVDDPEAKNALEVLGNVSSIESQHRK